MAEHTGEMKRVVRASFGIDLDALSPRLTPSRIGAIKETWRRNKTTAPSVVARVAWRFWLMALGAVTLSGCALLSPAQATCDAAAAGYDGSVAGAYDGTMGGIRALPAVNDNPQLARYADVEPATVCYINGRIAKGPPPPPGGTPAPPFDRVVVVIVGTDKMLVAAGYQQGLPVQAP
jgi:hypothetical protein